MKVIMRGIQKENSGWEPLSSEQAVQQAIDAAPVTILHHDRNLHEVDVGDEFVDLLLAIAGFLLAVRTVVQGQREIPPSQPVAEPARGPFPSFIAGAGIVEASTENIEVSTPMMRTNAKQRIVELPNQYRMPAVIRLDTFE